MNIFNKNKEKETPMIIINQSEELRMLKEAQLKLSKENGKNIAKNIGNNQTDLNKFPFVSESRQNFQSKANEVGAVYTQNLSICKSEYNQAKNTYENDDNFLNKASEIATLENEREEVLKEAFSNHDEDIEDKKNEVNDLKNENENIKTELNSKKKHNLKPRYALSTIFMLLLILGEIYLNKDAFSYTGLNTTASFLVGMAIATFTFMSGISKATIIRNSKYKLPTKVLSSIGISFLVMIIYYTLGIIRVSLMNSQSENESVFGLSAIYFMSFNLAFYVGIFFAKFFIFPRPNFIQDNDEYDMLFSKLKTNVKKIKAINKVVFNAYKLKDTLRIKIQNQYAKRINPLTEQITDQVKSINSSALKFNRELTLAINFYEQINADYMSCVASFVNHINLYRKDKSIQLLVENVDYLKNPFENITPIKITKMVVKKEEFISTNNKTTVLEKSAWEVMSDNQSEEVNYSFTNSKKQTV